MSLRGTERCGSALADSPENTLSLKVQRLSECGNLRMQFAKFIPTAFSRGDVLLDNKMC